jgi:hypothetical protein
MDPDPYLSSTHPDSDLDPAIFVSDLQDGNKNSVFLLVRYFLKLHVHHFSKIKSHKEVTKQKESKVFLTVFAWDDIRIRSLISTSY